MESSERTTKVANAHVLVRSDDSTHPTSLGWPQIQFGLVDVEQLAGVAIEESAGVRGGVIATFQTAAAQQQREELLT